MADIEEMEKAVASTNKDVKKDIEKKNNYNTIIAIVLALIIIVLGFVAAHHIIKKDSEEFSYENLESVC